ncbi:oligosaccharide flippase family protein [Hymenobacter taeanensis]|uniref:Oligosaccharide flippase family protein n=1 Tax=Hymenobacter taeanensis TaxID=2735321 RepID=A0A6M6BJ59_9BACT|nr:MULTISPECIES: oligosaccharide flippase family protein [Hymenobacter]QJX48072.1 oligosaccharide flippase family protein [Hymenobacter taeanensis]UOQ82470.1 oligosaccharide flippase family protein [Hymenobacter sp. 5414T-23]
MPCGAWSRFIQLSADGIKRFFGNISLVVLLNLLIKPGWVVLENIVQDRLGHAAFGLFTALSALTLVLATVSDLGLTHYSVKRVAADPAFLTEYFPTILPLRGWLNVAALFAMLGVGWVIGYRSYPLVLLGAIGVSLLLAQYGQFLRGTLQAHQHFNTDAVLSVFEKFLLLGLVLVLLPLGLTLERYVGVRVVAAVFTTVLLYGLMTRLFGRVRYRWQWGQARTVLRETVPFAVITLLYGVNERIDMVMLERLASPTEAGYYAGAYRWVDAVMMYIWTILPLFFAKFAGAVNSRQEQRDLLWFGQRVVTLPMLLLCAFVLFRGEVLFWQFKHSSPAEVARMAWCLKILFVNVLVHSFFALYASLLNSTRFVSTVSRLVAVSVALNIGLNWVFLPQFGAIAAAWNTLLCAVFVSGCYVWLVQRHAEIAVPWKILAKLAGIFGLLCAAWYAMQTYLQLSWLVEAIVAGALFMVLVLALRIVRPAELKQLRQRKTEA